MYKHQLPPNCPLAKATEESKTLFRIYQLDSDSDENYRNYVEMHPEREDYKTQCKAYGLSLFETKEAALAKAKANPKLGAFIAKVEIRPEHGKLLLTNKVNSHYTFWPYQNFTASNLNNSIEPILKNAVINS